MIENGVTSIGRCAFSGCTGLTSITIPEGVTSIGNDAFAACTGLTSITIPEGVTSIGNYTFYGCTGLTDITIPDGVTSIGSNAFSNCTALTAITIPDSVTTIASNAFTDCMGLENVYFGEDSAITAIGAGAIPKTVTLWCYYNPVVEQYAKDNGNKCISACGTFNGIRWFAEKLELDSRQYYRLTVSGSGELTEALVQAFEYHQNITEVVIEKGITKIGDRALYSAGSLRRVTVGEDVRLLGREIFRSPDLAAIYFLGDYPVFSGNIFADKETVRDTNNGLQCVGTTVYYDPTTEGWNGMEVLSSKVLPTSTVFGGMSEDAFIALSGLEKPFESRRYIYAVGGSEYGYYRIASVGDMAILNSQNMDQQGIIYEIIGDKTVSVVGFNTHYSVGSITIPDKVLILTDEYYVVNIAANAFGIDKIGAHLIRSVTVPGGITAVGNGAFSGCSDLEIVKFIGDKPATVGTGLFFVGTAPVIVHTDTADWPNRGDALDSRGFVAGGLNGEQVYDHLRYELDATTGTAIVLGAADLWADIEVADFVHKNGRIFMVVGFARDAFFDQDHIETVTFGAFIGYGETKEHPAVWDNTFKGMDHLKAFHVQDNGHYSSVNGMLLGGRMSFDIMIDPDEDGVFELVEDRDPISFDSRLIAVPAEIDLSETNGTLVVPEGVTVIERYAAYGNRHIKELDLSGTTVVGAHAFENCHELTAVLMPTVIFIEDHAFSETPVSSLALPDSLVYVGRYAFSSKQAAYRKLSGTIHIGKNVDYIGEGAFARNVGITAFDIAEGNERFYAFDGALIERQDGSGQSLIQYPAGKESASLFTVPEGVTGICAYAFWGAKLDRIAVADSTVTIGNNAFEASTVKTVRLGASYYGWTSAPAEQTDDISGMYTTELLRDCTALEAIEVSEQNPYFVSVDGILYGKSDRNGHILYCYPAGKLNSIFKVPEAITQVYDDAFRDNGHIRRVIFASEHFDYIGSSAFLGCSSLEDLYFVSGVPNRGAEAPIQKQNVVIKYFSDVADQWAKTRTWSSCRTEEYRVIGELSNNVVDADSYVIVVTDTNGEPIRKNGVSPVVTVEFSDRLGNSTAEIEIREVGNGTGIYTFAVPDRYFDGPCSIRVTMDDYFEYRNEGIYLDSYSRISYATLVKEPVIMGLSFDDKDINTSEITVNLASYLTVGGQETVTDKNGNTYEITYGEDTVDISVACYYEIGFGVSRHALMQNGKPVPDVETVREEVLANSQIITYRVKASALIADQPLYAEAHVSSSARSIDLMTQLNVQILDHTLSEDDVDLDTNGLSVDLANNSELLAKLFGTASFDVSLGKNVSFATVVDGDTVTLTLIDKKSKKTSHMQNSPESAYKSLTKGTHNKGTFFFRFKNIEHKVKVKDSLTSYTFELTHNIRFIASPDDASVYYFRFYIYSGAYENEVATFYGIVNSKSGREGLSAKAKLISGLMRAYVLTNLEKMEEDEGREEAYKALTKTVKGGFVYEEPTFDGRFDNQSNTDSSFTASLSGSLAFKIRDGQIRLVSGEIKGSLSYTFEHNSQFVIWVIPVTLEVEVGVEGEVLLKLRFDGDRPVSIEEAKLTMSASITARVGVGCKLASVGIYGKVGTVFVFEFYPDLGIESWKINADLGAYVKALWFKKDFSIWSTNGDYYLIGQAPRSAGLMSNSLRMAYVLSTYSAETGITPDTVIEEQSKLFMHNGEVYKLGFMNAYSLGAPYDAYNYVKLAWAKWNGTGWGDWHLIDDGAEGLNDGAYTLCGSMLIYTQQTTHLTERAYNDQYSSAKGFSIKCLDLAALLDGNGADIRTVVSGLSEQNYKYLPQIAVDGNGNLYVAWAENAENNLLGVSSDNYIDMTGSPELSGGVSDSDITGEAVIVGTTANSVRVAKYDALTGTWMYSTVADGLPTVTNLAVTADGTVAYIVDADSDPSTEDDRILYYAFFAESTPVAVNGEKASAQEGEAEVYLATVKNLFVDNGQIVYYQFPNVAAYEQNGETVQNPVTESLVILNAEEHWIPDDVASDMTSNGNIVNVYDGDELMAILFATEAATDNGSAGSAVYGIFRNGDAWGKPVLVLDAEADRTIASFSAVYAHGQLILSLEYAASNEGNDVSLNTDTATPESKDKLDVAWSLDHPNAKLTLTIKNESFATTDVYYSVGEYGDRIRIGSIPSGYYLDGDFVIDLDAIESLYALVGQYDIYLWTGETAVSGEYRAVIEGISSQYASLIPSVKYIAHIGADTVDKLVITVTNDGNASTVFDLKTYLDYSEISEIAIGSDYSESAIGQYMQALMTGANFAVNAVSIGAGETRYYVIELDPNLLNLTGGVIAVQVNTAVGARTDENERDNTLYVSLGDKRVMEKVTDQQSNTASVRVASSRAVNSVNRITATVVIDGVLGECLKLTWSNGSYIPLSVAYNGQAVEISMDADSVMIPFNVLGDHLPSDLAFILTFDHAGETVTTDVRVTCYTVTWTNGDENLGQNRFLSDDMMSYTGATPAKASTDSLDYVFVGWDLDGDGVADKLTVPTETSVTANAVFGEKARKYTVTWDVDGQTFTEQYAYGDYPVFNGNSTRRSADGTIRFIVGWRTESDGEIEAVCGDAVYFACLEEMDDEQYCELFGHTPGEAATCTTDRVCTVCHAILESATGHHYGDAQTHDEAQHKLVCACGDTVYESHHWSSGTETVAATATTDGEMTYTCTVCGETRTETIPAIGRPEVPEDAAQLVVGDVKTTGGRTVTVPIRIRNNPGIVSMTLTVRYDASVMTLTRVTDGGILGANSHKPELTDPYTLVWENDTATTDYSEDGVLVTLTFVIREDAELGRYPISVSYDHDNYDIYNHNIEKVQLYTVNGSVEIMDYMIGDVDSNGVVNNLDRMILARYLAHWDDYPESALNLSAADVNTDGVVNNLDRMILARHLANWDEYAVLPYTA